MVAQFRDGKLASEHVYWDQASVLVQIGKLDPAGFPVAGVEVVGKLWTEACRATSSWRASGATARANQSDVPFSDRRPEGAVGRVCAKMGDVLGEQNRADQLAGFSLLPSTGKKGSGCRPDLAR